MTTAIGVSWDDAKRRAIAMLLAALLAVVSASALAPPSMAASGNLVSVIVQERPGATGVEQAVRSLGGVIGRQLGIISSFAADVPASALSRVESLPGVQEVARNAPLHLLTAAYNPGGDGYSMLNTTAGVGARDYWRAGFTGQGIDVAVIDSGVAPVDGLRAEGKVVDGPDFSFESQTPVAHLDGYGHGTHMAGIIAGRDDAVSGGYAGNTNDFLGVAPDARIVSVKVADSNGVTDVTQVIAAIDWVVKHRNDPGMNIRVLNLSFGTDSNQDYKVDPLAFAVEVAARNGIVPVVAGGNDGDKKGHLNDPASDPFVLAVAAADTNGTPSYGDDTVPGFSSKGDDKRNPDLAAPGTHIQSLRDPGSYIDRTYGATGRIDDRFFRGSGTSQAAAVVSGAAALVLQQRPTLRPNQVKSLLQANASGLATQKGKEKGSGELNLRRVLTTSTPGATDTAQPSTGGGSLEASRGSSHAVQKGVALSGERDIFNRQFDSAAVARLTASGSSWSGSSWSGSTWSGSSWSGSSWSGSSWSGSTWSGSSWSGSTWSGSSWSGSSWSDSTWSGATWSGSSWSDSAWASGSWD